MNMRDAELLLAYARDGSEAAFTELVKRHVDLVYGAAGRQTGDAHLAEEVAQSVFCLLARKAGSLTARDSLAGWLYRATGFMAARALRSEQRRLRREREAAEMNRNDLNPEETWHQLSP